MMLGMGIDTPSVTVIMPSFNSEAHIARAIESVINQTFKDWELLIADDGSTDQTVDIALRYSREDGRIICFENAHSKGAAGARNSCLDRARGQYIAFLDSDDLWLPQKLELQLSFMRELNVAFTFSYTDVINEAGTHMTTYKAPRRVGRSLMRFSNYIPCLTAMYDSSMLGKVQQPDIEKRNDFALWLKILNTGSCDYAYCLPVVTAKYRANSYGLSSNKLGTIRYFRRCLIQFGGVSSGWASWFTLIYILQGIVKARLRIVYNLIIVRV